MVETIKRWINHSFLYDTFLYHLMWHIYYTMELRRWGRKGKSGRPPPLLKHRIVKEYANRESIRILVETGTHSGNMAYATRNTFCKIFSIELDKALYERAKRRLSKFTHISVIHGDSGEVLGEVLADIACPCLFWLDAHYCGPGTAKGTVETPILKELHYILGHSITEHVILIDDPDLFVGQNDYPAMGELRDIVLNRRPNSFLEVKDNITRIHKKAPLNKS